MNRKILMTFFALVFIALTGYAQDVPKQDSLGFSPKTLTVNEFLNFRLPPLETLFENAKNNPRLEAIQASIEASHSDLKDSKRDWLSFFSVHAGYKYGILGTYVDSETEFNPLTTTYSGASQSSWSVGANFNMPLDRLFNYKNNVKKQKKIIDNIQYTKETVFYEIKAEIIELYSNTQYQLRMLSSASESIILYRTNYAVAQTDFINNKITAYELSTMKNSQKKAEMEYESIVNQLQILLLKLELITNTKLISK